MIFGKNYFRNIAEPPSPSVVLLFTSFPNSYYT